MPSCFSDLDSVPGVSVLSKSFARSFHFWNTEKEEPKITIEEKRELLLNHKFLSEVAKNWFIET